MHDDLVGASLLLVVAHYDDEVLYCGGLLSSMRDQLQSLSIVVCTHIRTTSAPRVVPATIPEDERHRRRLRLGAFRAASLSLRARATELDVDNLSQDESRGGPHFEATRREIQQQLLELEDLATADLILTHGARGEYGHPQHQSVHDALTAAVQGRLVEVWYFGSQAEHDYGHEFPLEMKQALLELYRDQGPLRPAWRPETDPRLAAWTGDREWFTRRR